MLKELSLDIESRLHDILDYYYDFRKFEASRLDFATMNIVASYIFIVGFMLLTFPPIFFIIQIEAQIFFLKIFLFVPQCETRL